MTMPMNGMGNGGMGMGGSIGGNSSIGTGSSMGGGGGGGGCMGGWSAPLGVHKITSCPPGLMVTIDAHRRSPPVKKTSGKIVNDACGEVCNGDLSFLLTSNSSSSSSSRRRSTHSDNKKDSERSRADVVILAPGRFVEVLETQVHGGRVRGRVVWEEVVEPPPPSRESSHKDPSSKEKELPHNSLRSLLEPHHSSECDRRMSTKGKFDKVHTIEKVSEPSSSKFRLGRRKSLGGILPNRQRGKSPTNTSTTTDSSQQSDGNSNKDKSKHPEKITVQYQGWISLMWADDKSAIGLGCDGHTPPPSSSNSTDLVLHQQGSNVSGMSRDSRDSTSRRSSTRSSPPNMDEDDGPWTEPITLGVHKIHISAGLPLRKTSDRDSQVLDILEKGRYIEVVETQVKGDRVRARCMVPPPPPPTTRDALAAQLGGGNSCVGNVGGGMSDFKSGWISLVNAASGSSGASPVPLGAYVAVAECGCAVTDGCRMDSKIREVLARGACIEVVATRVEEGVVRGLLATGGYVSLFAPGDGSNNSSSHGRGGGGGGHRRHKSGSGAALTNTKIGNPRSDGGLTFAMPVPLGQYSVIYPHGLPVTAGYSRHTTIKTKLKLDDMIEVVETRVEDGKVRGRLSAIICAAGISRGWISLFDPTCRWAKFVGRDGHGGAGGGGGHGGSGSGHNGQLVLRDRASSRGKVRSSKLNF